MLVRTHTYHLLITVAVLLLSGLDTLKGQDIQFSQFYAASLYLNPAFTGNTKQFRVSGNYRRQWPKVPGYTSTALAYDQNIRKINSGVGLLLVNDYAGSAGLRFTNIGASYSYKFLITRKVFARMGARASHTTRSINAGQLVFWDQIVRNTGTSLDQLSKSTVEYLDFSSGAIIYSATSWIGFSFDHLTQPNQSFLGLETKLPLKYSIHGGHRIPLKKSTKGTVIRSFTMTGNYKGQLEWDQLDFGLYFNVDGVIGGLWYRGIPGLKAYKPGYSNNDALVLLLGFQMQDMISIGYSYDITISRLTIASGGSHELSLIYEFAQPKYKRDNIKKNFMMPCMMF